MRYGDTWMTWMTWTADALSGEPVVICTQTANDRSTRLAASGPPLSDIGVR